jgi:hypothetical protein
VSESCLEATDNRNRCEFHGGWFSGGLRCSKHPDPFTQAESQAQSAFRRQAEQLDKAVSAFEGWNLIGHGDEGWMAHGPAGRRASLKISAPTPHGLLERIRQATDPFHREPAQTSLFEVGT